MPVLGFNNHRDKDFDKHTGVTSLYVQQKGIKAFGVYRIPCRNVVNSSNFVIHFGFSSC